MVTYVCIPIKKGKQKIFTRNCIKIDVDTQIKKKKEFFIMCYFYRKYNRTRFNKDYKKELGVDCSQIRGEETLIKTVSVSITNLTF